MIIEKFQRKPDVVEAVQITWENLPEVAAWAIARSNANKGERVEHLLIWSVLDWVDASVGDWVIKDATGDFYVYDADHFAATHGPVS